MAVVAGVDFGTLSVRVSIVDSEKGRIGSATGEYPLIRKREDPDHATQRHEDHMQALADAMRQAGAVDYFPKDGLAEQLVAAIRQTATTAESPLREPSS